jgi:hypothetical protein
MPRKDKEARLAYQRAWYAKHREQVIAEVAERKRRLYSGVCRNCGGPTVGMTKKNIPEWCAKPACAAEQRNGHRREQIKKALASWNVRDG